MGDIHESPTPLVEESIVANNGERHVWAKRGLAALTVAAAASSLVVEQSPANEAFRVNLGTNILEMSLSDDVEQEDEGLLIEAYDELKTETAVGAGVGAATLAIEGIPSGLIALGLHQERGPVRALARRRLKKRGEDIEADPGTQQFSAERTITDKLADAGIALGIGAGLVVAKRHVQAEEPTLKEDLKTATKASGLVAVVSGGVGFLAAGGLKHADKVGLGTAAEYFVDYAADWKFWTGVVAVGYTLSLAKRGIQAGIQKLKGPEANLEQQNVA